MPRPRKLRFVQGRPIADALVMGKILKIEGGNFEMPPRGRGRHRRGRGG